jgi:hypothetical protein
MIWTGPCVVLFRIWEIMSWCFTNGSLPLFAIPRVIPVFHGGIAGNLPLIDFASGTHQARVSCCSHFAFPAPTAQVHFSTVLHNVFRVVVRYEHWTELIIVQLSGDFRICSVCSYSIQFSSAHKFLFWVQFNNPVSDSSLASRVAGKQQDYFR